MRNLDLMSSLFRYEISAVDSAGQPMGNPASPLLARIVRPGGKMEFIGFVWRGGRVEIFSASPQMEIVQLAPGYRVEQSLISHGMTQLGFFKLPPVRLLMPGLRALLGSDMQVRVSMVLVGDTGLPSSIKALDQRSGKSQGYSRAQLSKSGGAWLRAYDEVQVPLMRDGEYQVVVRLRPPGAGSVAVVLGNVNVRLGLAPVARVEVVPAKVQAGLVEVVRRQAAARREQQQRSQQARSPRPQNRRSRRRGG